MKKLLAIALVLVMALGLCACGGNSNEPAPAATPAPADNSSAATPAPADNSAAEPADNTEPAAEPITLRIGYMPNYASLWGVLSAIEQGCFAEEGITIDLTEFGDGPTEKIRGRLPGENKPRAGLGASDAKNLKDGQARLHRPDIHRHAGLPRVFN